MAHKLHAVYIHLCDLQYIHKAIIIDLDRQIFMCLWFKINNVTQMFAFGRIQQIQLLGRDMRGSEHDQLWNQIEAEIHLHRHKTVIRACRGRKDPNNKTPAPPPPPQAEASVGEEEDAESKARKRRGIGEPRTVVIHKDKTEGLGISITVRICSSCYP